MEKKNPPKVYFDTFTFLIIYFTGWFEKEKDLNHEYTGLKEL